MAEQPNGFDLFLQFLQNPLMYQQADQRRRQAEAEARAHEDAIGRWRQEQNADPYAPAGRLAASRSEFDSLSQALASVRADPGVRAEARQQLEDAGVLEAQRRELAGIQGNIDANNRGAMLAEMLGGRETPASPPTQMAAAAPPPAPPPPVSAPRPAPVQVHAVAPQLPVAQTPPLPAPVHYQMTPEILQALLAGSFEAPPVSAPQVPNIPLPVNTPVPYPFPAAAAAPQAPVDIQTGALGPFGPRFGAPQISTEAEPPPFPNMLWRPPAGLEEGPPPPFPGPMGQQAMRPFPAGGPGAAVPFSPTPPANPQAAGPPFPLALSPLTMARNAALEADRNRPPPQPQVVEIDPPGTFVNPNSMRNVTPTAASPTVQAAARPQAPMSSPALSPLTATPPVAFDAALQGAPQPSPHLSEIPEQLRSMKPPSAPAPSPSQGGPSLPTPTPMLGDAIDPKLKAQLLAMLQAETLARLQGKMQPAAGMAAAVPGP